MKRHTGSKHFSSYLETFECPSDDVTSPRDRIQRQPKSSLMGSAGGDTCSEVSCLPRACSTVARRWLRARWSDWTAEAVEVSTWRRSCSASSWRTSSEPSTGVWDFSRSWETHKHRTLGDLCHSYMTCVTDHMNT